MRARSSTGPLFLWLSLATLGAASLGACNVIVGSGDFAVGTGGGGGDDASVGIDSSIPGNDGASPESGSDAASDAGPVTCGNGIPTTAEFQKVVDACVLWAGCTGRFTPVNVSTCISWDWFGSNSNDPQFPCLAKATTCAAVTACLGEAWATKAQCAGSTTPVGSCSGSTALNCQNGQGVTTNCAKYAGTTQCGVYALANDGGTAAACVVEPTCKPDAGTGYVCDTQANFLYTCIGGVGYGASCAPSGYQCATYASDTDCWIQGPTPCGKTPGQLTCADPTTMDFCTNTQTNVTLHCATAGGTCASDATGATCVSPGCTQAQATACKESCESNRYAHLCIGGAPLKIDCKTYPDLTGCVVQSNGFATCVP